MIVSYTSLLLIHRFFFVKIVNKVTESMFLSPITFVKLKQKIASLKNKAGGYDGIHAYTLKTLSKNDGVVNALLFILNSCFFSGKCLKYFKIAEVIPFFKAR